MKRIIVGVMALVAGLSLVSCGGGKKKEVKYMVDYVESYSDMKRQADDIEASYGNILTEEMLPSITLIGYIFEGWYYDMEYTLKANAGDKIKEDLSLYAKWSVDEDCYDDGKEWGPLM